MWVSTLLMVTHCGTYLGDISDTTYLSTPSTFLQVSDDVRTARKRLSRILELFIPLSFTVLLPVRLVFTVLLHRLH